jgi:hypothetical protein
MAIRCVSTEGVDALRLCLWFQTGCLIGCSERRVRHVAAPPHGVDDHRSGETEVSPTRQQCLKVFESAALSDAAVQVR